VSGSIYGLASSLLADGEKPQVQIQCPADLPIFACSAWASCLLYTSLPIPAVRKSYMGLKRAVFRFDRGSLSRGSRPSNLLRSRFRRSAPEAILAPMERQIRVLLSRIYDLQARMLHQLICARRYCVLELVHFFTSIPASVSNTSSNFRSEYTTLTIANTLY
jgi:hypothetical protein